MNRAFHATFVPKLFRELHICSDDLTDEGRAASLLSNRQTCHVRILNIQARDTASTLIWMFIRLDPTIASRVWEEHLQKEIFQTLSVNTNKLVSCMPRLMGIQYVTLPPREVLHDRESPRS